MHDRVAWFNAEVERWSKGTLSRLRSIPAAGPEDLRRLWTDSLVRGGGRMNQINVAYYLVELERIRDEIELILDRLADSDVVTPRRIAEPRENLSRCSRVIHMSSTSEGAEVPGCTDLPTPRVWRPARVFPHQWRCALRTAPRYLVGFSRLDHDVRTNPVIPSALRRHGGLSSSTPSDGMQMRTLDMIQPHYLAMVFAIVSCIATAPLQARAPHQPQVPRQAQLPRLEAADACPMELPDSLVPTVQCGWLVVPQHWDSDDGRVVRIAFAVARATGRTPEPDPILYLEGGPSASLDDVSYMLRTSPWMELRQERDLIFTDQRGTGYSAPRLCGSLDEVLRSTELLLMAEDAANSRIAGVAAACADSMAAGGMDPAAVNADAIARDVDALRSLLGHQRWNLYGVSYGGRVAEMLMRRAPSSIRSVVLDSPSPVGVARTTLRALDEALEAVFSQCAADSACAREYPELEQDFHRLMDRLENETVVIAQPAAAGSGADSLRVNRPVALAAMQRGLYGEQLAPLLPLIISQAAAGNDGALLALKPILDRPWSRALDMGAGLAAYCVENPAADGAISARERSLHPRVASPIWTSTRLPALCDSLHAVREVPPPAAPGSAVGIPVLILGGGHDSSVAPSRIRQLAERLDSSTLVFAEGLGHGLASRTSCTRDLVASFFADPGQRHDTDCVSEHSSIPFVTDTRRVHGMSRFGTWIVLGGGQARMSWLLFSLLVLASPALLWSALWVVHRIRGIRVQRSAGERRATGLVVVAGFTGVVFLAWLVWTVNQTISADPGILSAGAVVGPGRVFLVPWLLVVLTAALLAATVRAWRQGYWSRWRRIHYSLASAAGVSALLFIGYWGLF